MHGAPPAPPDMHEVHAVEVFEELPKVFGALETDKGGEAGGLSARDAEGNHLASEGHFVG